jgi:hypothetical protein
MSIQETNKKPFWSNIKNPFKKVPSAATPSSIPTMGIKDPLMIFQPANFFVFTAIFSPAIIAVFMIATSLIFQNFKGLIFIGFMLGISLLRHFIYKFYDAEPFKKDNSICSAVQFTQYGNPTFSSFMFAFTIIYIIMPMIINGEVNFWILGGLLMFFFLDMFIKIYKKCITKMSDLLINILLGGASAALIVSLMYAGGSSKFLYSGPESILSSAQRCSMPSEQTFKCSVYKNGELISG